ncbi:MAG: hypothetical protein HKN23_05765 [Verrucomicrobiales bacterium]|nr:hypothetical protein [Verrucomicrobiales bacterium]
MRRQANVVQGVGEIVSVPEAELKHSLTEGLTPIPERFGPVFVKELRQGLRARIFVWPFVALQLLAIFVIMVEFFAMDLGGRGGGGGGGAGFLSFDLSDGLFFALLSLVFGLLLPLTLFSSLQPELAGGRNVELLLMSNLTRWQIVRGKWLVGSVLSGLMIISLVPYALTRYFIGGVDLAGNLYMLAMLVVGNAVMNGIVIGASGFRNILVRIILVLAAVGSWTLTSGLAVGPAMVIFSSSSGAFSFLGQLLSILLAALSGALFVAYGLQLGRAQLRLFENPIDPPSSGLIIALIIFTPIIVGVTTLATVGFGAWIGVGGLLVLALFIDRGPGKNKDIRFAQA